MTAACPERLQQITDLLESLIAIPSETARKDECERAIEFVEGLFSGTSLVVQHLEQNGVFSLVIAKKKRLDFDLLFLGHLDVVPAADDAFIPQIRNGRMYGRGTSDMKGECAVMIQLFLEEQNHPMLENAALILTTDEEVGGFDGVGHLIDKHNLRCRTLFNPDGGGEFAPCTGQKGVVHLLLTTNGVPCHASRPWEGTNAIEVLLDDLNRVREAFSYANEQNKELISLNIGKISGGQATNAVAESAAARLDLRFPAPHSVETVVSKITNALRHATLSIDLAGEPVHVDPHDPAFEALMAALEANGFPTKTKFNHTASDARWFVPQQSSILLMLPEASGGHIENECVSLASLGRFYNVIHDFCERHFQL